MQLHSFSSIIHFKVQTWNWVWICFKVHMQSAWTLVEYFIYYDIMQAHLWWGEPLSPHQQFINFLMVRRAVPLSRHKHFCRSTVFVKTNCCYCTRVIRWFLRFSKREVLLVILNRKVIVQVWLWGGESGLTLRDALVHFRPAASVINILFYISVADNSACCVFYDAFEFLVGDVCRKSLQMDFPSFLSGEQEWRPFQEAGGYPGCFAFWGVCGCPCLRDECQREHKCWRGEALND